MREQWTPKQQQAYLAEATSFRFQFDTPQRSKDDLPIAPVVDDPLYEWDFQTRERVVSNCHSAAQRNPLAKAGLDYTTHFVIGDGFNLACKNPDVEQILQDFIDNPDNDIRVYEKQILGDLQTDGEVMLRYFKGSGDTEGQTVVVPLRPWECQSIETEPGMFRRRKVYNFNIRKETGDVGIAVTEQEPIPAENIQHIAINRRGYELRGRPELYVILPWLRAYKEWLEGRARLNHWGNAFIWHDKVAAVTPNQLAAVVARNAKPPSPGSIVTTSDKEEITAINANIRANDVAEDGRQIKLMSVMGLRMPEYMLGDGENANLASATAQQLPAMTKFADFQQILTEQVWRLMFKRVLQNAIDAGVLPEQVEEYDSNGDPVHEEIDPDETANNPELAAMVDQGDDDMADAMGSTTTEAFPPANPGETGDTATDANANDEPMIPDGIPQAPPEMLQGPVKMIDTLDAFDVTYEPISKDSPTNIAQAISTYLMNEIIDKQTAREEAGFDHAVISKRLKQEQQSKVSEMAAGMRPIPPGMLGKPSIDPTQMNGQGK